MDYKLIACDLDGTLFNSDGIMSEENSAAITELALRGVHFIPSSGRTFSDIPNNVRNHPAVRYIIHSSGAVIFDKRTQSRISFCMPNKRSALSCSLKNLCFIRIPGKCILFLSESSPPTTTLHITSWYAIIYLKM